MQLHRLYAFLVEPARNAPQATLPSGGSVTTTKELRDALSRALQSASFSTQPRVDFVVDETSRTNEIRDAMISLAFGNTQASQRAAETLATRLSSSMDGRSDPALLVLTSLTNQTARRVILWLFPRDRAFQFHSRRTGASLSILTDVFSQTSNLRKAASFEGRNVRNEFLSGHALDFQAGHTALEIANFWISRFLHCAFAIQGAAATRLLATALRDTLDRLSDTSDKEQLLAAIMAIPRAPRRRITLRAVADGYLSGAARAEFEGVIPNDVTFNAAFDFSREEFERVLHYRIFQLESGVFVSSPLGEVGRSVMLTDAPKKRLTCAGTVAKEKVRARNA